MKMEKIKIYCFSCSMLNKINFKELNPERFISSIRDLIQVKKEKL